MPNYRVRWEIDLEAVSPQQAARQALATQRHPESIATVFDVVQQAGGVAQRIDLGLRVQEFSAAELATVLAALRLWQQQVVKQQELSTAGPHFDDAQSLSAAEIDELCERLNCA